MTSATGLAAPLAPVRERMLRDAADQAARIVADARREAEQISSRAQQDAAEILARAQAVGQQDGAVRAAAERAKGRSEARTLLLRARAGALDGLRTQVLADVAALCDQPGYGQLRDRLAAMARLAAGRDAEVTRSPDGGVLARSVDVTVDCSLARLADLAVQALGPQVRELWTP
jgi:vacuolar-type H+-ATPase subunit E/Vma4